MESFFATMKGELVEGADYQTRDQARAEVGLPRMNGHL